MYLHDSDEPCADLSPGEPGSCFKHTPGFEGGMETFGELWDYFIFTDYTQFTV